MEKELRKGMHTYPYLSPPASSNIRDKGETVFTSSHVPLMDVDTVTELEMLNEIPTLLKKIIDSSPFAKDNVILSVKAQLILDELRRTAPLNPFLLLHNNIRKYIKLRDGIILKLLPFKGYRLIFANGSRRFR